MRVSSEDLGGLSMMSRSGGLKERAVAGRPWKVHFISWGRRWKSSEKRKASSEEKVCVWEREKGDKSARGRVGVCAWERGGEGDRKREIERKRERELNLSITLDFICIRNIYDQNYNNEKKSLKIDNNTVSDQVDPEELNGDESLRKAERGGQEDGNHLTNVGGNQVSKAKVSIKQVR